jgi:hypothetical protein
MTTPAVHFRVQASDFGRSPGTTPRGGTARRSCVRPPSALSPRGRTRRSRPRYLIGLLAVTSAGRDPRRQKIIAGVLTDFRQLLGGSDVANHPP